MYPIRKPSRSFGGLIRVATHRLVLFACSCWFVAGVVSAYSKTPQQQQQSPQAQGVDAYASLVAQAQADLDAGNLSKSLDESQRAIKLDPNRWQGYIAAAGALEQQKMFDAAVDSFTDALAKAPEDKRAAIKELLQKCMQEKLAAGTAPLAEAGSGRGSASTNSAPAPDAATSGLPSKINPNDGLTYVRIPPGGFQMGCSPDDSECIKVEKPAHTVTITKGFWIGQTPVTQAAWKKVAGSDPSSFKGDQLPVENVTWDDAKSFCEGVGMRLPTEAEYEYAARGGNTGTRYGALVSIAWYVTNSGNTTHAVAQKEPNAYGLYDMLGNVWEWVADWYGPYHDAGTKDPKGPPTGQDRVLRGASWLDVPSNVRASYRVGSAPGNRYYNFGFRCAGN